MLANSMAYAAVRSLHPQRVQAPTARPKYGEALFEGTSYPREWGDYVGQERAKAQLKAAIRSACIQERRLDHVLISSPVAGIGKTALALLTAFNAGVGVLEVSGKMGEKELRAALRNMEDGDILFIDEIHRLADGGKKNAEPFLHILQDGVLMTAQGAVQIPDVCVIGATTDKQRLDATIIDRFPVQCLLSEYSDDEAIEIGLGHATRLGFGSSELPMGDGSWLETVASAANRNPRNMVKVLVSLRDFVLSDDLPRAFNGRSYDLTTPLEWCGLTEDGLDETACAYLVLLAGIFQGTAGQQAIASALGEKAGVRHTEQLLLQKGYLIRGPQGRTLTESGWERAEALSPSPNGVRA